LGFQLIGINIGVRPRRFIDQSSLNCLRYPRVPPFGLVFFAQEEVADDEHIHVRAHEAPVSVLGVQTIGSPRTLKLVLMMTGQPVLSSNPLTKR